MLEEYLPRESEANLMGLVELTLVQLNMLKGAKNVTVPYVGTSGAYPCQNLLGESEVHNMGGLSLPFWQIRRGRRGSAVKIKA